MSKTTKQSSINLANIRQEITREKLLKIINNLNCKSSTKRQLKLYYSYDINIESQNYNYRMRLVAKAEVYNDYYYKCKLSYTDNELIIKGENTDKFVQEFKPLFDNYNVTKEVTKYIIVYAYLIDKGYFKIKVSNGFSVSAQ
jgi:hypothetical protein